MKNIALYFAMIGSALLILFILYEAGKEKFLVNIGLSTDIDKKKRHGMAWVKTADGGMVNIPFLADRPENLTNPTKFTVRDIFMQINKMGMCPQSIEVTIGGNTKVYRAPESEVLLLAAA